MTISCSLYNLICFFSEEEEEKEKEPDDAPPFDLIEEAQFGKYTGFIRIPIFQEISMCFFEKV